VGAALGSLALRCDCLGICPSGNDPQCWTAEFTCRRCCDIAHGPEGDTSCWTGFVNFDVCCAGRALLNAPPDDEVLALCYDTAAFLQAGRDPLSVEREKLLSVYRRVKPCAAIENVLHLALLTPALRDAQLHWMKEQAIWEAEGILQWFVDSLVTLLGGSHDTQGFAMFMVVHRLILESVPEHQAAVQTLHAERQRLQALPGGIPDSLSSKLAAIEGALVFGDPFDARVAAALLVDAAAAADASVDERSAHGVPMPCSLEAAMALVAQADIARLADGPGAQTFFLAMRGVQRCLDDVTVRRGPLLKQLMKPEAPPLLLALDRLECKPRAVVSLVHDAFINVSPERLSIEFTMTVLPVRDWESDFVRGYHDIHCAYSIRELIARRAPLDRGGLFVDVGANIGGCALWGAHFMKSLEVVAVEPLRAATEALNATIRDNGLADRMTVVRACVRQEGSAASLRRVLPSDLASWSIMQPKWELERTQGSTTSGAESGDTEVVQCRRLDEILHRRVAVMRIHTSGTEDSALASAAGLARRGLLGAVALQFPSLEQARFLWRFGLSVELAGRRVPHGDEAAFEQARLDPSVGHHGLLVAVDSTVDEP